MRVGPHHIALLFTMPSSRFLNVKRRVPEDDADTADWLRDAGLLTHIGECSYRRTPLGDHVVQEVLIEMPGFLRVPAAPGEMMETVDGGD